MRGIRVLGWGALLLALVAGCKGEAGTDAGGGGTDAALPGTDTGTPTTEYLVVGDISASITWTDSVILTGDARILPGVTVTIAAGTDFRGNAGTRLTIEGTLLVQGTEAEPVTVWANAGATSWGGFNVASGGTLSMSWTEATETSNVVLCSYGALGCDLDHVHFYDVPRAVEYWGPGTISYGTFERMNDGGVTVQAGADLLLVDSWIRSSVSDLLVMGGGTLVMDHCEIGLSGNSTSNDTYEHCDVHISSSDAVTVTNTNFVDSEYGLMIGGSNGAVFHDNNFLDSPNDVLNLGANSAIDLTTNYWVNGAPSLPPAFDTSSPAAAPIPGAGPRPE